MTIIKADMNKTIDFEILRQTKLTLLKIQNLINKNSKDKRKKTKYENIKYIIDNYNKEPIEKIAKKTGYKINSIKDISYKYGLNILFLKENEITLCELYRKLVGAYSDTYNIYLLQKHGLNIYMRNGWKIVNICEFYDWYKNHIKIIQIFNYTKGSLPNEPDWFLEKAEADKLAREYTYKRIWTKEEDIKLKNLVNQRKTYFEISKELKRTGNAIKRRCLDLKIDKPKRTPPIKWTGEQKEKLKELWFKGYEPCVIQEKINRSDREIIAHLERFNYFGMPPQKYGTSSKVFLSTN